MKGITLRGVRKAKAPVAKRGVALDDDSDDDGGLQRAVASKRAKVEREFEASEFADVDKLVEEFDKEEVPPPPGEKSESKYLGKILEARRQRQQDQHDAQLAREAQGEVVFESEEFARAKEEAKERQAEERDDGSFYSNMIQRRLGSKEHPERPTSLRTAGRAESKATETEDKAPGPRTETTKPKQPSHPRTFRDYPENPQDTHFVERVKEFCRSKITPEALAAYRQRYWRRRKAERS